MVPSVRRTPPVGLWRSATAGTGMRLEDFLTA